MEETCYMCEGPATTFEHAPPKSFFPEQAVFLTLGIEIGDMRKNLVTVPSCSEHNNSKSNDDVFIRSVLLMNQETNSLGQKQFLAKVKPAFDRDASLLREFAIDPSPVLIRDSEGIFETNAMTGDMDRINGALDKMGRAIHFHHFKEKWLGKLWALPLFAFGFGWDKAAEYNKALVSLRIASENRFANTPEYGENKEVFYYNVIKESGGVVLRLTFYGGAKVLIYFLDKNGITDRRHAHQN